MKHFLTDDGERIHVRISGDGPPIILLHGWTSNHRDWTPFVEAFEACHRVFRWDARAHDRHQRLSDAAPTLQRMAQDLDQMLAFWDLRHAVIVGHSMGALTLWQYLRDFGAERVARAVFIDQSPKLLTDPGWNLGIYGDFDEARNQDFICRLGDDFPETVLALVAEGLNERSRAAVLANGELIQALRRRLQALDPGPLIECWASLARADFRDLLPQIKVPSLLVFGDRSDFYPVETAHYLCQQMPNARLQIYPDADHAPHLAQPRRFVAEVLEFIGITTAQAHQVAV